MKKNSWYLPFKKPKENTNCNLEIWIEVNGKKKSAVARDFVFSNGIFKKDGEYLEYSRFDKNLIMWQYNDNK